MNQFWRENGSVVEFVMLNAMFALSTFVALWAGVLSLAAAPFAAATGFVALVLIEDTSVGLGPVLIVGPLLGMAVAYLVGRVVLRLETHWVALSTIALVLIARVVVLNIPGVTGGAAGRPIGRLVTTWHVFGALLLTAWVLMRHRRSRFGLAVEAVRGEPNVAGTLGVDVQQIRLSALVLSGAIAGTAGVLYAQMVQYLSPDTFYVQIAFTMLASTVLGGAYFWAGPIVGAALFTVLPEVLRQYFSGVENIVNGVVLILIMIYLPKGLVDPGRGARRRAERELRASTLAAEQADEEQDAESRPIDLHLVGRVKSDEERDARGSRAGGEDGEQSAIEVTELVRSYGGIRAVDDLTLRIPKGSVFGVLGPNGAGKSTLVNLISGLEAPDGGRILLDGIDVTGRPPHVAAQAGLGRTFQTVRLFEDLTVLENIIAGRYLHRASNFFSPVFALPSERRERQAAEAQARELMDRVGIIGRPDQPAGTLSYANQRRIEIARALATEPSTLLLDEPTAGMHLLGAGAVGELMLELQDQGITVVVVEHNMKLILDYCDIAAVMNFGQLLSLGRPEDCLSDPSVREAYFGNQDDARRVESLLELRKHQGG